jgi:hypothetical protein
LDSDGDGVGDLKGLIQKLDYINDGNPRSQRDLGARCIWLMPVAASPSYHGYDVTNYYQVNPEYGTNDDFRRLVAEAHRRGIRVLVASAEELAVMARTGRLQLREAGERAACRHDPHGHGGADLALLFRQAWAILARRPITAHNEQHHEHEHAGIRVTGPDGGPPGRGRALIRTVLLLVDVIIWPAMLMLA